MQPLKLDGFVKSPISPPLVGEGVFDFLRVHQACFQNHSGKISLNLHSNATNPDANPLYAQFRAENPVASP